MSKKGQAALEFMMTYGWAILVVLAAIGALSYFGVLDPARFTPDTCMASSGFSCDGKPIATPTSVAFTVTNGIGYDISLDNSILGKTKGFASCIDTTLCDKGDISNISGGCLPTKLFKDGTTITLFASKCNFGTANVVKGEFELNYSDPKSGLPNLVLVTLVAKPK
jgi:hypothetical protein